MSAIEQQPVLASITIFFLGVLVTIVGFFIQRRFFSRAPRQSFKPTLHVSPFSQDNSLYAELNNIGNDPVKNLAVEISWLQDGTLQSRPINRFFNYDENPVFSGGHDCTFLNASEKKKMASIPKYSDDGVVTFKVTGLGVNSGAIINDTFLIPNEKR